MHRVAIMLTVVTGMGCGPAKPPVSVVGEVNDDSGALVIEPPIARYVSDLDLSERREQVRDWAVFGTVTHLRASADSAAAATYEFPPARLPYLDELYSFEHGRGRRIYLDGRVLLFRDADDPDPQATIGRLADRVRMESGEVPATVEVYAVHDLQSKGTIRVERLPDVSRDELFSPAYGYIEETATDAASLAVWLESADDLTIARITEEGRLVLGGRRFAGTRTQNLTAEDVAALYQAHDELEQPRAQAAKWLAKRTMQTRLSVERVIDLVKQGKGESYDAWTEMYSISVPPGEQGTARAVIRALAHEPSPGFSLDPEWLPDPANPGSPLFLARLRAFIANPCDEVLQIERRAHELEEQEPDEVRRSSRTQAAVHVRQLLSEHGSPTPEVCAQVKRDVAPPLAQLATSMARLAPEDWKLAQTAYARLARKLEPTSGSKKKHPGVLAIFRAALDFHDADTSVQCGTYWGLRGTRVGMTLFYTDLLAKLWGSDYGHSTPTSDVPGFLASPFINLPPSFADELQQISSTRLWFGPRADAASRTGTEAAPALLFDHRFTRIYAAGSDPGRPEVEVQPVEGERRSIGWWDRHFEEVADFEQEYHRQNQIMKWAVVTASLAVSPAGDFLKQVRVERSLDFHGWYAASRGRLRFSEALPAPPAAIAGKECLPLISSYSYESADMSRTISGGVATVTRGVPVRVPQIRGLEPLGARKPYVADLGAGKVGTSARPLPTRSGQDVTFFNATTARTRAATGEVQLGTPTVKYQGGNGAKLEVRAGSTERPIGALEVEAKSTSRVQMNWKDGAVETARRDTAFPTNLAGADKLAASGYVDDAARVYQRIGGAAGATTRTADDLARQVVVDSARRRAGPVLQSLQKLESKGAQLAPEARSAVEHAVSKVGSPAAAKHVSTALRSGQPLTNAQGRLVAERGQIIVSRDIDLLPAPAAARNAPKDLSGAEVYIDGRLRVGREGLASDTGATIARWRNQPGVTVEMLDRSAIGALPDQLVVRSAKLTLDRVAKTAAGLGPPVVFVIRKVSQDAESDGADRRTCGGPGESCAGQR